MITAEIFLWWYASGWRTFIQKNRNAISSITDFFSMGSLVRTLFKPYRQISAETANANSSIDLKFHMFLDRLVSRFVGFCSRLMLLLAGSLLIIVGAIISLALIILWPFIPLLPIAGIILTIMGVTI